MSRWDRGMVARTRTRDGNCGLVVEMFRWNRGMLVGCGPTIEIVGWWLRCPVGTGEWLRGHERAM
jgi:hypothetical protein